MCAKERNWRKQTGLAAMALFEEAILDHLQVKLTGNQDVNLITESEVLQISETDKIRELYRALSEIPETAKGKNWKKSKKFRKNGKRWGKFKRRIVLTKSTN